MQRPASAAEPALAGRGLRLVRAGRTILDGLDFTADAGTVTAIVGPNGAGKSTLLKVLCGEIAPSAGTVFLNGRPIAGMKPAEAAARRAVLPQSSALAFPFNVREIAELGLTVPNFPLAAADRAALVERALATVDLADRADRLHDALSGGERQRAHLARVLCQLWAGARLHGPGVLMLDEPTASQDLAHQLRVLDVARAEADAGGTVVVVLHDLNLAARYADRFVVIAGGRVAAEGPPASVLTAALLREVFAVALEPGRVPADGTPFVLPQVAARIEATSPIRPI